MEPTKLYLFLSITNRSIGGSYIYMANKLRYYSKKGWDTQLIHYNKTVYGDSIPELKKYDDNYDERLSFTPIMYSSKKCKRIIKSLVSRFGLDSYNETVIETSEINMAYWGELLAQYLHAKHFVLLLGESVHITSISMFDFFNFKLKRHELAGITVKTIPRLFNGWPAEENLGNLGLSAYCSNCIDNIPNNYLKDIPDNVDYIIGLIGRVSKPFFWVALDDLVNYFKIHSKSSFFLVIIGGVHLDYCKKRIDKMFSSLSNADYLMTGPIYPVPLDLLKIPKAFVSSAGSCSVSAKIGKPTISYDGLDLKPIGIFQITASHALFRSESEPVVELYTLLDSILIKKEVSEYETNFSLEKENDIDFSDHEAFLQLSSENKEYFDVMNSLQATKKEKVIRLFNKLFRRSITQNLLRLYHSIS